MPYALFVYLEDRTMLVMTHKVNIGVKFITETLDAYKSNKKSKRTARLSINVVLFHRSSTFEWT